jgi:tRNA(fMet)-specific endonuclease VapC
MKYVLDTDTLTHLTRGHVVLMRKVYSCPVHDLSTTVITVEEQLSGWYDQLRKAKSDVHLADAYRRLQENTVFLGRINILPFTEQSIARWRQLKQAKLNVRAMDLKIAAIALDLKMIVVSRNTADFERVPGLVTENWMS